MMNLDLAMRLLPGLIIGLSLHEFAHAWSASLLGDNFARRQGRVSLNPFRHLSITGTLAILFLPMGWGKPVMVNLYNFKHPKRDYLITSLAGPLANIFIILVCLALAQFTRHDLSFGAAAQPYMLGAHRTLTDIALINGIMATFNLLPIPPLDGSKIWPALIPGLKPSFGAKGFWIFLIAIIFLLRGGHLNPVFDFTLNSTAYYMPYPDSVVDRAERSVAFARCQASGHKAFEAEKYTEAEKHFTEALELEPNSANILHWRSVARLNTGNLDEALADINRAIATKENCAPYIETRQIILQHMEAKTQPADREPDQTE